MLNTLILSKNKIEQVKGVQKLNFLKKLSLSHNKVREFDVGHGLGMLQELRLNDNRMVKFPELQTPALKVLDVGNNPIVIKGETKISILSKF